MTRVWACLYNQLRFRSRGDTDVVKCVSIATQRHEEEVSVRCCLDGHKNLSFSFPADVWSERTAPSGRKVVIRTTGRIKMSHLLFASLTFKPNIRRRIIIIITCVEDRDS